MAVLLLLSSCALIQKPRLTFKSSRLANVTLTTVTLETVWDLENPNWAGATLQRADAHVFVEDQPVATGSPPPGLKIPARGHTELVFPAEVKLRDVLPAARAVAGKDTARYRVNGSMTLDTSVGTLDLPIEESGEFEVPKMPAMRLLPPELKAGRLELLLELTNRNSIPLPLAGLAGTVTPAGQELSSVSTGAIGTLAPHEARVLRMPIALNIFTGAAALQAALRGEHVQVGFDAVVLSGGERIPVTASQVLELVQ
jgi:LEA14-like dessication related protein